MTPHEALKIILPALQGYVQDLASEKEIEYIDEAFDVIRKLVYESLND